MMAILWVFISFMAVLQEKKKSAVSGIEKAIDFKPIAGTYCNVNTSLFSANTQPVTGTDVFSPV